MAESHWEGIASWCDESNYLPLGFVEGLNSRIRKIQAQGYGYKDIDDMNLKILTCMLPEPSPLSVNLDDFLLPLNWY
ncbi:MAG: hypothetical protein A2Z96_03090 [Spirochaetes bacterium GWB1_48_6]|nr:MAG: hypothetical protein A2Z96_03090 [Spirochaetes bacterium GWB1_48_6]OHE63290.1 MAG: hypothetical protein A2Y36_11805 [Treponema sp. GWA1_62_8]OHE65712.1 MAG: hypothetical protein A2001_14950 [Treponema sp. GWC1_61_84]HCM25998.1 hypothetical protein [Treponema sp.]